MPEYQPLTADIQVPKEWLKETAPSVILDIVKLAINHRLSGQAVIVTIGKVSALVAENETRTGYLLENTENTEDEGAFRYELYLPAKVEMVSVMPNGRRCYEPESVQILPMNLRFEHPVSRMVVARSDRHKVVTAVPNIEKILSLKRITGPEVYNHMLKLTYMIQNVSLLDDPEPKHGPEPLTSAKVLVSVEWVTDSECKVVYFERVIAPRRRRITYKTAFTWTFLLLGVVLFVLLIYYLVLQIKNH